MLSLLRRLPAAANLVRAGLAIRSSTSGATPAYPAFVGSFNNLIDMQEETCNRFGDNNFIGTWSGDKFKYVSYREFGRGVDRFRTVLSDLGVTKGDKVAIISNNRPEWAVSYYAVNGRGAVLVPLYEAQTEKDWRFIIHNCEAKVLIVATEEIYAKTMPYFGESFPKLETIICLKDYPSLINAVNHQDIQPPLPVLATDLSAIMYTSGSTGLPKGVALSHANITSNMKGILATWGESEVATASEQKKVCYLPWSHAFGMIVLHTSIGVGTSLALVPSRDAILSTIDTIKPPDLSSVPILLNKIYAGVQANIAGMAPAKMKLIQKALAIARARNELLEACRPVGFWLDVQFRLIDRVVLSKMREKLLGGNLKYFSAGGGKTSVEVLRFFEDIGIPVREGYGMTETGPVITMSKPVLSAERRLGAVGRPIPGVGLHIRHPDTLDILKVGQEGEICVTGPCLAVGYYKNEAATKESFLFDSAEQYRYLRTGDLGSLDADGFLTISGRIKEQYKLQNGKFVSPAPIEDYINRSVYIAQTAVYGDNQEFNVALIVPELNEIKQWAIQNELLSKDASEEDVQNVLQDKAVVALINTDLRKYSIDLKHYEYIRKWVFLNEPFSHENDLLTQKMTMKRQNVYKAYRETIFSVFSGEIGNSVTYHNQEEELARVVP